MKMLIATAALVTLIATPVLAQSVDRQANVRHNVQTTTQAPQFGRTGEGRRHSTNPANDVYDSAGHYIGSDPDQRIRDSLQSDRGE
jgi:uncharacterized protein YdeI (BOF family)